MSGGQHASERASDPLHRAGLLAGRLATTGMRLAEAGGNVFSTWEWVSTWWRHSSRLASTSPLPARPAVACWHPSPSPGVPRPARVARFLGHGPADELGPVCAPADRIRPSPGSGGVRAARLDLLLAELLPGGYSWKAPPRNEARSPGIEPDPFA